VREICACGCGRPLDGGARGLSATCHQRLRLRLQRGSSDELLDFPRRCRPADDVLDDWAAMRADGATREEAAERLGMALESFERVLYRHADDPRAVWGVRRRERASCVS